MVHVPQLWLAVTAYPISRADLSVAAGGAGEGGELGDRDALLAETHHVVPTPCPVLYEPRAYDVFPRLCSEGAMGGEAGHVFLCSLCKKHYHNYLTASNIMTVEISVGTQVFRFGSLAHSRPF